MDKIKILSTEKLLDQFFEVDKVRIQYDNKETDRYVVKSKKAVAILLQRSDNQNLILLKQWRLPVDMIQPEEGWIYEIPAGVMDKKNESPQDCAVRECLEETGYQTTSIKQILTIYPSPGYTTEQITLFHATTDGQHKIQKGGGLQDEHEMIEIEEIELNRVSAMLQDCQIKDAKTIIALQWLLLAGDKN